jgi:hypothetical protein
MWVEGTEIFHGGNERINRVRRIRFTVKGGRCGGGEGRLKRRRRLKRDLRGRDLRIARCTRVRNGRVRGLVRGRRELRTS